MPRLRNTALLFVLSLTLSLPLHAKQTFITVGTGGMTGVYYPTGVSICKLVNLDSRKFCRKFCVFFDVTAQGAYTPFLNENLREPSLEGGLYARLFI